MNLANNQGHLGRTIKATTSRKNLESIGKSALIGGIRVGAGAALGVASSYAAVGSGGLSAGVSYLGMAAGADMMVSGSSEAFGTYHHKEGYRVLRSLTKPTLSYMQETSRDAAITAVEYGLAAGSTRIAGKVADAGGVVIAKASKKIAARKVEASASSKAAVQSGVKKPSSIDNPLLQEPRLGSAALKGAGAYPKKELVQKGAKGDNLQSIGKELFFGEGSVDKYGKLKKISVRDGLDAHHAPNDKYMQQYGISKDEGVAILVRNDLHREIHKKMRIQDPALSSRDALAQNTLRVREVYIKNELYLPGMKKGLVDLIRQSKDIHPLIFMKPK